MINKKLKRVIGKARRQILQSLPKGIRHKVYRGLLNLPDDAFGGYEISVASSIEDLSAAFALLHDQYVKSGYMEKANSGKRFTFYHALPSTTVFVAKKNGKVVGTCSVVLNNHYGLPAEKIF